MKDEQNTVYDIEIQTAKKQYLPRRIRYYLGLIDLNIICRGASNNIVNGYDEDPFGTNDSVTREQLATILYRSAKSKGQGFTGHGPSL